MKIKKVEIQAFRAYDKVEDATFDFVSKDGDVSNFVTLYAPNGFGKTSFYDAVEWGVTNNISRFLRNKTENKTAARAENNKFIWRHNNSDDDTPSFVKISTDEVDNKFERYLSHKIKSNQKDTKFDDNQTDENNKYFLDVILSQEEISAFLKEDNSSLRYDKFINAFGDKGLDRKYKKLIELIQFNKNRIKEINARQKEIKELLKEDVDNSILSKINEKISAVNKNGLSFPSIKPTYNDQSDSELKIKIIEVLNIIDSELSTLVEKVSSIDKFIDSDNIGNIVDYNRGKNKLNNIDKEIEFNKIKETNIGKLESLDRKLEQYRSDYKEKKVRLSQFEYIETNLSLFENIKKSYYSKNKYLHELNKDIVTNKENKDSVVKSVNESVSKKSLLIERKNNFLDILENADDVYKDYSLRNNELNIQRQKYSELKIKLDGIKKEEKECISIIDAANSYIKSGADIYASTLTELLPNLSSDILEIKKLRDALPKYKQEYTISNVKLQDKKILDDNLKELVEKAKKIISEQNLHQCPVCNTDFKKIENLLDSINSNDYFSGIEKTLVQENDEIYRNYILAQDKIKKKLDIVKNHINNLIDKKEEQVKSLKVLRIELVNNINKIDNKIKVIQSLLDNFKSETQMRHLDDYKSDINNKIDKLELEISNLDLVIEKNKNNINIILYNIDKNESTKKLVEEQITELSKNEIVSILSSFVNDKNPLLMKDIDLSKIKNGLLSDLKELNSEVIKITSDMAFIKIKYKSFDINEVRDNLTKLIEKRYEIESKTKKVKAFIDQFVDFEFDENKDILSEIIRVKKCYQLAIKKKRNLVIDINTIEEYRNGVIPFLKHASYLEEYNISLNESNFLSKVIGVELEKERRRIASFIDERVQSFFYQDLINSFYKKIDPHPKYKDISFRCDFSNDKPRLHVLVKSEDKTIVPTLYFSSAQLNVLSLSIFLAKAINVRNPKTKKDVDTIFVDDPIQAMDSINILSVIDLLRSITINFNKQIILSTHDENFYQLIKKKVPEELFSSKFIELESYGKVSRKEESVYDW
ncbi:exonuclease SbcC domain protein [Photobacterium leiognathi lrivu.4.1]|uniref:Exonuclease SbcC domain protein n=1 Tax=Photobacterium leiognathi lrivu.4.1 TaxID=1248232 RepID=X0NY22_PHOLE|nr:AAA family ATPase [Photobacterium leiognathi]GAD29034.1 exonuclease SbcC domain protein [Photobacterium leiognathi lrivu.4.1]